jgi:phage-related protein
MTNFQNLMIEYQNITDALREGNSNFKGYVMQQTENMFELVRSFKQSQQTVLKAITGVIQNVINQE